MMVVAGYYSFFHHLQLVYRKEFIWLYMDHKHLSADYSLKRFWTLQVKRVLYQLSIIIVIIIITINYYYYYNYYY